MQIRMMKPSDIPYVVKGEIENFGETLGEHILEEELKNVFAQYYVVEKNQMIIGYIGLWITPPTGQIINFYIDKKWQNKGIGSALLEYVMALFNQNKVTIITLEVRESNENAQMLYLKFGFKKSHIRKNYYKNGENAIVMLKEVI